MRLEDQIIGIFLVFCRIGTCLMVVPGLSTARVPARVRLYLALAVSVIVSPNLPAAARESGSVGGLAVLIAIDCAVGFLIGMLARAYLAAIEFTGTAISNYIGLGGIAGAVDTDEPAPALSTLLTIAVTTLLMILDFPQMMIVAVVDSYDIAPSGVALDARALLVLVTSALDAAFLLGLKISAPFLAFGVLMNVSFAVLGKLVPQVPSYFISTPAMAIGGLAVLYLVQGDMMQLLVRAFSAGLWRV